MQLYVGFENSTVERPVKLLRGFAKVALAPGETKRVEFEVPVRELAYYDPDSGEWKVEAATYPVFVGPSSRSGDLLRDEVRVIPEEEES